MSSNPFVLISMLISAMIAFVTIALVVNITIYLFNIKDGRIRAVLRLAPYVSLALNFALNGYGISHLINPLNCSSCLQKILMSIFYPELQNYLYSNEISLVHYLGSAVSHGAFYFFSIFIILSSAVLTIRKLYENYTLIQSIRTMTTSSTTCIRPILNLQLARALQVYKVKILVNDSIAVPMATHSNLVFIPKAIVEHFPQEEFEAILAHELEHIRWKDPMVRLLSIVMSTIFWWVPTKWWHTNLELDQEIACDQSIARYGFSNDSLASALLKVTSYTKNHSKKALCYLTHDKHPLLKRLQVMVGINPSSSNYEWKSIILIIASILVLIVCAMW